jgi:hypothetical protein
VADAEARLSAPEALVGTWRLVSWENTSADGDVSHPLGEDPQGLLVYGADGFMAVALMRSSREPFARRDLLAATEDERARAAGEYVSYCGRYEVRGDLVVHRVELSLFPNWIGLEQERHVELAGDRLTLSTAPVLVGGREQTARVTWKRA